MAQGETSLYLQEGENRFVEAGFPSLTAGTPHRIIVRHSEGDDLQGYEIYARLRADECEFHLTIHRPGGSHSTHLWGSTIVQGDATWSDWSGVAIGLPDDLLRGVEILLQ